MKLYLKKTSTGLIPIYEDDKKVFNKIEKNLMCLCDIKQPRNLKHHKKFFAILRLAVDNWPNDDITTTDQLLDNLKLNAGFVETFTGLDGEKNVKPKSIQFTKTGQIEFSAFYDKALDILGKYLDISIFDINENADSYM